jgi:hypothetical protein
MHVLSTNHNYGEVEIEETAHMKNNVNTNVKESLYTYLHKPQGKLINPAVCLTLLLNY